MHKHPILVSLASALIATTFRFVCACVIGRFQLTHTSSRRFKSDFCAHQGLSYRSNLLVY
jgi:hypothetical protein